MRAKSITITAGQPSGMINGIMSLIQLTRLSMQQDTFIPVECWEIEDSPLYAWRGFMLDEARHFWGMRKVKQILDWMAFYKLNRFHWHLTDSQGWRIEIKKYPKLTNVFNEYEEWSRILKVSALPSLNKLICSGKTKDIIFTAEALHEKKIAEIADKINKQNKKIVLIAGPSSSGKTTFAKRLAIQLLSTGKMRQVISLDDYYKNRDDVPEDSNGRKNFENLSSLDIEQFNKDMLNLLKYRPVNTPLYDMVTGLRKVESKKIQLTKT